MKVVSVDELINQKILPFDLYNEDGEKIFNAGEVLTPGKLLQLRYISVLYREDLPEDDLEEEGEIPEEEVDEEELEESEESDEDYEEETEEEKLKSKEDEEKAHQAEYENEICCIPIKKQKDIKNIYKKAFESSLKEGNPNTANIYSEARDRIVEEVIPMLDEISFKSQLKIYGEYNYSHGINVSIFSTALAYKLRLSDQQVKDVALGAMLHDIGKTKIPKELIEKMTLTTKEAKLVQLHPQIGYKIIRKEMGLPDNIAKVALEHHERNDGSGYPYGISGDLISIASQIVIVCDIYDALTSNRGHIKVKNPKEAMKVMLDIGSKWFTPSVLYTFVHMSNFNDTTPLF